MSRLRFYYYLLRYYGICWISFRMLYGVKIKLGYFIWKSWIFPWKNRNDFSASYLLSKRKNTPRFFFSFEDRSNLATRFTNIDNKNQSTLLEQANAIGEGIFIYFSHQKINMGFPPLWHKHPLTHEIFSKDKHWSQIDEYALGDIKYIWELSRFHFVYPLVRAYWRTGNEQYANYFWCLVEDWYKHNPPNMGANWRCGQEISIRVLAWCFGLFGFLNASSTSPARITLLIKMINLSGERIETNLNYALSQYNNHGVMEGLALWTIGVLFPELKRARRWEKTGHACLEWLAQSLIYSDGAFSQHSFNYQRLTLQAYLWALRLADLNNRQFSAKLRERVKKSSEMLYQLLDLSSGQLPNYGSNDGALLLPLTNCDYIDFRPLIQSLYTYFFQERPFAEGPWDEEGLWLLGSDALTALVQPFLQQSLMAPNGGYYTLRTKTGFAFTRCATFKHRPGQADMLHCDIWWQGINILTDPGTYSYHAKYPWNDHQLAHSFYHNTVTVDNSSQMQQYRKFIWLPWVKAHVTHVEFSQEKNIAYWQGEYRHPIKGTRHQRAILCLNKNYWLICDRLSSKKNYPYRLHFLLPDFPHKFFELTGQLILDTPRGEYTLQSGAITLSPAHYSLVRASSEQPFGWRSLMYGQQIPALSYMLSTNGKEVIYWTLLGPAPLQHRVENNQLYITMPDREAVIAMGTFSDRKILKMQ